MDELQRLESESITILREAFATIEPLAMLWSIGKDSNAMVWLAKKAFFGRVPFPVVHVDTGLEFPEVYEFRDRAARDWSLDLIVAPCPPIAEMDQTLPPGARSASRKTAGLKNVIASRGFKGIIAGIRRDEQSTRAKERVFSPRGAEAKWDFRNQPPEFWGQFAVGVPPGGHVRIHPLLGWTELDIWRYIEREQIPVVPLYFARDGMRFRSLGESDITVPVPSKARQHRRDHRRAGDHPHARTRRPHHGSRGRGFIRAPARGRIHVMRLVRGARLSPPPDRPLRTAVVGHVDHGKSTLVGRLLHETGALPEGRLEQVAETCRKRGMPFEWAFVTDSLQIERDQGVTVDVSHIRFRSALRPYVLIDAPGHREFVKNMVTGAAAADAAVLVIDAAEGVREQSRRHGLLLSLLGVAQIAVVINKMDLVGFSAERFAAVEREYRAYLASLGVRDAAFIPVAARDGDNVTSRSARLPWYSGGALLEILDTFTPPMPALDLPLRLPIQDVYKFDQRRIFAGRIESGFIAPGDEILFSPSNRTAKVKTLESWSARPDATPPFRASAGEAVGFTLEDEIVIDRGEIVSRLQHPPVETDVFRARLFWLSPRPLAAGARLTLRLGAQSAPVEVQEIGRVVNSADLAERDQAQLECFDVGDVVLRSRRMLALDPYAENRATGRFVLVEGIETVGGGVISMEGYPDQRAQLTRRAGNLGVVEHRVSAGERMRRNGHRGGVVWLTGLSGAGKSTLAVALEQALFARDRQVFVLDGDNLRHGLTADLGFSPEDRSENIRRVGEVAALFAEAGFVVVTAFISPYRSDRARAREAAARNRAGAGFHEVYVRAPLALCEQRDPKGLYRRARAGQIAEFTGISAPYEAPDAPELVIDTEADDAATCVARLADYVLANFAAD